jgi:hypothetical protein
MLFRIVASILYSKANYYMLVTLCAGSLIFLLGSLAIDIYHYRVWWHYRPSNDNLSTPYSLKHRRYLPYHLLGDNRNQMTLGNEPCSRDPCDNRELEHILIYHHSSHQPQERWVDVSSQTKTYVGFHRTSADAAVQIAHSDMRLSRTPPQMLGFGIYFARSIKDTGGKARHIGAIICAKIRMGEVRIVEEPELPQVRNTDAWHQQYDTIYYKQASERRDEFCIKSSDQIIEWVMVVEKQGDSKVQTYGLDTEFSDTRCGCI